MCDTELWDQDIVLYKRPTAVPQNTITASAFSRVGVENKFGKLSVVSLEHVTNDRDWFSASNVRRGVGEARQDLPHPARLPA
jgi:hypothetical protein